MKQKKDGRYMNCYVDDRLLTVFEQISSVEGKTKTRLLEEAMARTVEEYVLKNGVENISVSLEKALYKGVECHIINECSIRGSVDCVILRSDGMVYKVPRKDVEIVVKV